MDAHRAYILLLRVSPRAAPRNHRVAHTGATAHRLLAVTAVLLCMNGAAVDAQTADSPEAIQRTGVVVTDRGTVELHLANQPITDVLQLLSLEGRRNIIASPEVTGSVTANLYNVTFEEALEAILVPNGAGFRKVGNFIYVYTNDELTKLLSVDGEELSTEVFTLNYINAKDAVTYITPLLDEGETVTGSPEPPTGLVSQATDGGGDNYAAQDLVVVTARHARLKQIGNLIRRVDVRPRQVLIEATILRAALDETNSLGIDFTIVGGVDLENLGATSNAIQDLALGQLPQNRLELFNAIGTTTFADNVPSGGFTFGIIKDKVAVFLRALEQVTDTTVLANPKILALNKQKGQVIVGRRDGYLTTTVTETQAVQTVEFLETGTQLIFRPFIGNDGFVRMELHPEDSVGFVNAQGLPSEQTTEVTTNVVVKDGQTILIGGLFREVTTNTTEQIPGLGNLPLVGSLFRSKNDSTTREEVIILLTVHIVKDSDRYAEQSWAMYNSIERIRVGMRSGLMWHGRERLAQYHYQAGLDEFDTGDRKKALWHARMALCCEPRFQPAMQLKERIEGAREWDHDSSVARNFMYDMIARERGYRLPPFGRLDAPPLEDTVDTHDEQTPN